MTDHFSGGFGDSWELGAQRCKPIYSLPERLGISWVSSWEILSWTVCKFLYFLSDTNTAIFSVVRYQYQDCTTYYSVRLPKIGARWKTWTGFLKPVDRIGIFPGRLIWMLFFANIGGQYDPNIRSGHHYQSSVCLYNEENKLVERNLITSSIPKPWGDSTDRKCEKIEDCCCCGVK